MINIPRSQPLHLCTLAHVNHLLRYLMRSQNNATGMKAGRSSALRGSLDGPRSDSGSEYDAPPSYEAAISTGFLADAARSTGIVPRLSQPLGSSITD